MTGHIVIASITGPGRNRTPTHARSAFLRSFRLLRFHNTPVCQRRHAAPFTPSADEGLKFIPSPLRGEGEDGGVTIHPFNDAYIFSFPRHYRICGTHCVLIYDSSVTPLLSAGNEPNPFTLSTSKGDYFRHYRICVKKIDCTSVKNLPRDDSELVRNRTPYPYQQLRNYNHASSTHITMWGRIGRFSEYMRFLAQFCRVFSETHYVCDFCFFSSRKRRDQFRLAFSVSFRKPTTCVIFASFHRGREG